jgi:pilus assembly protein Flp/PilA
MSQQARDAIHSCAPSPIGTQPSNSETGPCESLQNFFETISSVDNCHGKYEVNAAMRRGACCRSHLSKDLQMRKLISRLRSDEEGAALIEYGMLVGLIAVVCVVAVQLLGTQINTVFTNLTTVLTGILPT